ncbi:general secretion pathway protein GspN [Pseudomonas sp. S75]|uniref:general secretion pathway protein GspN n=1 Tax=unclassified Pseudomonas TaxID=196821 RepID=UPI001904EE49|nr:MULTISPECIES: general secretion pathway protein GspN [unclassified Pseudomonas]MBJ9976805.1 general secretion pathway protein GspN [Pseudomonas sp. S30]MBK0153920.1 general secretion pathway protein GspN [Pseudomonas sp. S75]
MRERVLLWPCLVCAASLLVELPAHWPVAWAGVPASAVQGTLWRGQAARLGDVGPLRWRFQPGQLRAQLWLGYQGQDWHAEVSGWPWHWRGRIEALASAATVTPGYRLAGQWQGQLDLTGRWRRCVDAQGRLQTQALALVAPWSLDLGQGWLQMRCAPDWQLQGALDLEGEHRLDLDASLMARHARLAFAVQPQAALTPLLRGAQWLGPEAAHGERQLRW